MVKLDKDYILGVLRGGSSTERDISLLSGKAVLEALKRKDLNVRDIIVPENKDISFLKRWILDKLYEEGINICFIALHGWFGEDGLLQEILEEAGYLYTGSGPEASRKAMDKVESRNIFEKNNIPVPQYKVLDEDSRIDELDILTFPLIIKPSSQGSSVGVVKVNNREELNLAFKEVIAYDSRVIIEEYIEGYELTVGILEDRPLPVIRIVSSLGLYNFRAKYTPGYTKYIVPADIGREIQREAQYLALESHKALGCGSFSRVDILYSCVRNKLYVLEVNTIPGLTRTSLLPKAARAEGIEFDQLILKMLKSAFEKEKCLK